MKYLPVFALFLACAVTATEHTGFKRSVPVEVLSGRNTVRVKINQALAYEVDSNMDYEWNNMDNSRGLHVIVLNQATAAIMAQEVFDTYDDVTAADDMVRFLKMVSPGRILIFATLDEASLKLTKEARDFIGEFGSKNISDIGWRSTWAMICFNNPDSMISEGFTENTVLSKWAKTTNITTEVTLKSAAEASCNWAENDEAGIRRKQFCERFEGYGSVCNCKSPSPITFHHDPLPNRNLEDVPVAVVASNRPNYLFSMLKTMLQAKGSDARKTVVFIDGYHHMPVEVAKLFGVKSVQHAPVSEGMGRVSEHYKSSMKEIFGLYPKAKYAIILEEDLEVAPDFFFYFSQTLPVLEKDPTLYCVSAWNDQGYDHTCNDASMLYRVETMPGLGWLLKRSLFKEELEPKWPAPKQDTHWDLFMRLPEIRKERECIIPDVSRTYHFGVKGIHMNKDYHDQYFANRSLNMIPDVKLRDLDRMVKPLYEVMVIDLIKQAYILDHSKTPCDESFFPDTINKIYVLYIQMADADDFNTFKEIAKCLHIWDIDMRGFHKSMWRMFYNRNQFLIVGVPASPYSKIAMPKTIKPISFRARKDEL